MAAEEGGSKEEKSIGSGNPCGCGSTEDDDSTLPFVAVDGTEVDVAPATGCVCAPRRAICHDNGISESEETEKLGDTGISLICCFGVAFAIDVVVVAAAVVPIVNAVPVEVSDIFFGLSRSIFAHGGSGIWLNEEGRCRCWLGSRLSSLLDTMTRPGADIGGAEDEDNADEG